MAVNINSVYQKVLTLLNKEQRGYLTPQEFNLLADRAQNEIFENYFHQLRNSNAKIKDNEVYTDTLEMIQAKISPFVAKETNTSVSSGILTFINSDDTYAKIINIREAVDPAANVENLEEVSINEFNKLTLHGGGHILNPTSFFPIYKRIGNNPFQIQIYPTPSDGAPHIIDYYRTPRTPSWEYVVVNEKALYNSNLSDNFTLDESEEEPLVSKILMLSGVVTKQQEIGQVGANAIQMTNQEQNS